MRILINGLFLIPNQVGGSETYLRGLLGALAEVDRDNEYVVALGQEAAPSFEPPNGRWRVVAAPLRSAWRPGRLVLEQLWIPRLAATIRADVIHSAGYTAPLVSNAARVTTVHDMNYKRHPEDLSVAERAVYSALIPLVAARSQRVLTVSEAARADIVRWTAARPAHVVVVHSGVRTNWPGDPRDDAGRLAAAGVSEPFVLAVAAAYPHKNLWRLVSAFPIATASGQHVSLAVVGLRGRAAPDLQAARRGKEDLIKILGRVDDALLASLYRRALALAFPSLYEGFGLPILEAMALGTPVVTSNYGAMAEVAGDAAELIDPLDVESIRKGLERVVVDASWRDALRQRGFQRAAQFTWQETARKTLEVYMAAIQTARRR